MAFSVKKWVDRISEYPSRRVLTDTSGGTQTVTVSRSEGTISQEGDAFNAENMNNLESRINAEFVRMQALTSVTIPASAWSDSTPYSATVAVTGVTSDSNPEYALDSNVTNATVAENFGFIDTFATGNGVITLKCLRDKPTVAIPIVLKGI